MYSGLQKIRLGLSTVLFTHAKLVDFGGGGRDFIHFYLLSFGLLGFRWERY